MTLKRILLIVALIAAPATAGAQNREHLQMSADLRIIQEQVAKLQIFANQLSEEIKAINKRLDDQANASTKGFADQQVLINNLATNVTTVREKMDDNSVRVSQMTQESRAIRDGLRALTDQVNILTTLLQPHQNPQNPDAPAATPNPSSGVRVPDSPRAIFDAAMNDYISSRDENAIGGFKEFLEKFPDAPEADRAQFFTGEAYLHMGKFREAVEAYDKVISSFKASTYVPDAHFQKAVCYQNLGQGTQARREFELIVREYPNSSAAARASQRLANPGPVR